jgi:hypothetical protein
MKPFAIEWGAASVIGVRNPYHDWHSSTPMKTISLSRLLAATAAWASIEMLSGTAHADDATAVISRKGAYSASDGASGTGSSTTTLSKGAAKTTGAWTNAAGGKGTWLNQRNWNRSTQSGTYSGSATRPNGATSTWQGTTTRTAPGVFSSGGTITLANGKQVIVKSTDTRVSPGNWTNQQVITTPSGQTIDRTVDSTVTPGNVTSTATSTLPNGQTVSSNASITQTATLATVPSK